MLSSVSLLSLLLIGLANAATSVVAVEVTATQAVLAVVSDQAGACTFKVSETDDFSGSYVPIHDVDVALFAGSDQCGRPGNIGSSGRYVLVVGKRTAEIAGTRRYSRALGAATRHYYQINWGADTVTGSFVTGNIRPGNTRNDPTFDRARAGEYQFPSIDWSDDSQVMIDPTTGLRVRRLSGPGQLVPETTSGRAFDLINGAGWSGGSYSGTARGYLYLRATVPTPGFTIWQSLDALQLEATLSGTLGLDVCLTQNGVTCAGATVSQGLSGTPTPYTIGSTVPILESWRSGTAMPARIVDVVPATGTVNKTGATVTWATGRLFPPHLVAGSLLTLGATDCAIGTFSNEKSLTLADAGCVADGTYAFTARTFGFLLRASTADSGTIAVVTPTWTAHTTGSPYFGTSGHFRICSPVKVAGPGGVMGTLCSSPSGVFASLSYSTQNPIWWFGDDGSINLIGLSGASAAGTSLSGGAYCGVNEGLIWDRTIAAKWYCLGYNTAGRRVIYSIRYTGTYENKASVAFDELLSSAVVTVESDDLSQMADDFSAGGPISFSSAPCGVPGSGTGDWRFFHRQVDDIMLFCNIGQEYPSWLMVFRVTTGQVVGLMTTWGGGDGAANRWGGLHSVNVSGDQPWLSVTYNPLGNYGMGRQSAITAGTLTSTFSSCPANAIDPSLAGQVACSTVTLADIVPTNTIYGTLYNQPFRAGDGAVVYANGADDEELVRILVVTGTTLVLQRDYRPYWRQGAPTKTNHIGSLALMGYPGAYKEQWWAYEQDPHGQSTTWVFEDPLSANCHQLNEFGIFIIACTKFEYIPGAVFRNGWMPASLSNTSVYPVNWDAFFAGSSYIVNILANESHPSSGQYIASDYEKLQWFDARPYSGETAITGPGNVSNVSGQLWKVAAAATASVQYRLQGLVGLTGAIPLVDASPAVLGTGSSDNFKFCYVVRADDCRLGSVVGEIYFNVPFLTSQEGVSGRFASTLFPSNEQRDITFTQNTFTMGTILQAGSQRRDVAGQTVRRLTTSFAPHKEQNTFWNVRPTPDATKLFWGMRQAEFVRDQYFIADLPPWPALDSVNRGAFVPVPVALPGAAGDEIRIRFGYSENGPAANLYCHERQVPCATSAAAPLSFVWTDETQSWAACDAGCTVNVPAIAGRVLYYVVDRRNGVVTSSSELRAVAVP